MLMTLSGPSRPPFGGGKPASLVILLHGRGSNGEDLLDLQRFWEQLLPDTEFVAPNAPTSSDMTPNGYEWFKAADRSPASVLAAVRASASSVDTFISQQLQKRGPESRPLTPLLADVPAVAAHRRGLAPERSFIYQFVSKYRHVPAQSALSYGKGRNRARLRSEVMTASTASPACKTAKIQPST
jgi:hypothetical protein